MDAIGLNLNKRSRDVKTDHVRNETRNQRFQQSNVKKALTRKMKIKILDENEHENVESGDKASSGKASESALNY